MRRNHRQATIALSVVLFSLALTPSHADVTPSPTPSPTATSFKALQEQYKKDREAFIQAVRNREQRIREINSAFKASVDKATYEAKTLMATATTPDQKNAISAQRRSAVAAAIVARESAVAALGSLPTPPTEPVRPTKMASPSMSDQKAKPKR
jgi:hypothetical protein